MTTFFCPYCWSEIQPGIGHCPQCGVGLEKDHRDYTEKLISALRHPEPLTQRRAAYVLGLLAEPRAAEALLALLWNGEADPYVRAQAAEALGAIGTPPALMALEQAARDLTLSVLVRDTAVIALEAAQRRYETTAAK